MESSLSCQFSHCLCLLPACGSLGFRRPPCFELSLSLTVRVFKNSVAFYASVSNSPCQAGALPTVSSRRALLLGLPERKAWDITLDDEVPFMVRTTDAHGTWLLDSLEQHHLRWC
jgi:hypothetical protein